MYDKKIAYLHYIKNNGLMGNAGHAKVMYRGSSMSLEIYVRDMQMLLNGYYLVKGLGESEFEDKIHIERGQAVYKKRLDVDKTLKKQVPCGIRIEIRENEYLEAVWQAEKEQETNAIAVKKVEMTETNAIAAKKVEMTETNAIAAKKVEMTETNVIAAEKVEVPETDTKEMEKEVEITQRNGGMWSQLTFSVPTEMYEDKWKELCKKYDVVYPFGNSDAYISISPKDFIIFPEKYQNLVNNSFLLHGYYNYQHIILGRKEESGKGIYYLGVPGVYYEREKMVAIMFGFEGFECGDKRVSNGGFGYYMRRVEL